MAKPFCINPSSSEITPEASQLVWQQSGAERSDQLFSLIGHLVQRNRWERGGLFLWVRRERRRQIAFSCGLPASRHETSERGDVPASELDGGRDLGDVVTHRR